MDPKDKKALEAIRGRAEDRKASPEIGGVREWFEIDHLLEIVENLQIAPVYVVMSYCNYAGGRCHGAFLDKEQAISIASAIEDAEYVKVQTYVDGEEAGTAYYTVVD